MYIKNMPIFKDINDCYSKLIDNLLISPIVGETKELTCCSFTVENPNLNDISFWPKKLSEKYVIEELKWYWSGSNSCKEIGQYAKMWLNLTDDGETSNSAYGYIIQKKYGYNQLEQIIQLLRKDKNTRRAVINLSDPQLNKIETKDMQCTVSIQFLIRYGKLHEIVNMRSNDINYGFPYDYIFFVSLGLYIARRLNIEFGWYTHFANSLHLYLKDAQRFYENIKYLDKNIKYDIDWERIIKDVYTK